MIEAPREIELKLELTADALKRLKTAPAPAGFSVERARTRVLRSIYFDTPDMALRRAKWSLRVRKVGTDWIQTVKAGTGVRGGLSTPKESETRVEAPAPDLTRIVDPALRDGLWGLLGGAPLSAVFETEMRRTTRVFRAEPATVIEVALDSGEVRTLERALPLHEAEFELVEGRVEHLFGLARDLRGTAEARFSGASKAQRGYALLAGEEADIAPKNAGSVTFSPENDTAGSAFQTILRSCLDQIATNREASLALDAPEGPHQMRVGLRRLRSALKIHRKHLPDDRAATLDAQARDLAARVGALRDLDVLAGEIVASAGHSAPDGIDLERLRNIVLDERENARAVLRDQLRDPAVNALLFDLGAMAQGTLVPPDADDDTEDDKAAAALAAPVTAFAAQALEKRWKAVSRLGAHLDELSLEERHDMRKALKKLRYAIEFYKSLYKKKSVKPFLSTLKKLQDVFGYLNDVVMAHRLADLLRARDTVEGDDMLAVGFVIGWHERRAEIEWERARALWDDTRHARKFWRD
ncbi:CYTH and CHAD domain-containing protein [Stappia sp. ES.058]|uniref:CYTH and CHAD domain-containing protein n=1 Tax=Stappia sp. ES.058 TaxID=1881061 RepID=UPI00087C4548|nr:CYTH and CHAD domain-containing protein [Stappia sp. ES.058]SDU38346.1 Inorganic triphosphatase YgiF, contains CYTH and CHAD domains [Stappia sp. ES.058]